MDKPITNRQKAALETKQKLIDAALSVISEKGFENISVDNITEAAGVAKGTFYTYFKKKEDIIEALNQTDFYRLAEIVNAMEGTGILEKLKFYCSEFLKGIERTGIEVCRQWIRNNISPTPMCRDEASPTKYKYDMQALSSVLNHAVETGQLTGEAPVEKLALLINSELYGLMVAWCMSDADVTGSDEISDYLRLSLKATIQPYLTNQ